MSVRLFAGILLTAGFLMAGCSGSEPPLIPQAVPSPVVEPTWKVHAPPGFGIGAAIHGYGPSWQHQPYKSLLLAQANTVTATAYLPYGAWPDPALGPDTSGLTAVADWADRHAMRVHGHALLYPAVNMDSDWYMALPNNQVGAAIEKFITTMVSATRGQVWVWDVVNEVMASPNDYGNDQLVDDDGISKGAYSDGKFVPFKAYQAMGSQYIAQAFRWANQADKQARLIINDFGIDTVNPKSDKLFELVVALRSQGVPIHGIGVQIHWAPIDSEPDYLSIRENFARFANAGFEIYLTETDVAAVHSDDPLQYRPDDAALARQESIYTQLLGLALEQPAVKAFLLWDGVDGQSWWQPTRHRFGAIDKGLYLFSTPFWGGDAAGSEPIAAKPAYHAMRERLQNHQPRHRR